MASFNRDKLARGMARGSILIPYLDAVIQKFDETWMPRTFEVKEIDHAWHPSGDCLPAPSELYKSKLQASERSIGASLRKSFMVGHFWHAWIQFLVVEKLGFATWDDIEKRNYLRWDIERQRGLDSGLSEHPKPYQWVRGSADIVPLVTPTWSGLVDIKTMSARDFSMPTLPAWVEHKYLCQVQIYMDLFDQEQAMILAVLKDSPHDFKEFTFVRDQKLIDRIYEKWEYVGSCLEKKEVPTDEGWELPF